MSPHCDHPVQLKGGNDVTLEDGTVVAAADCVGDPIPGRKVVILGDTCDSRQIADVARDADMLVHEATHDDDLHEKVGGGRRLLVDC